MPLNSFDKELISTNLLGATNLKELHRKEKLLTNTKMLSLQENPIEGNLDYRHLKAIHKFLFSEVYSWAGQDRYDAHITAKFGKDTTHYLHLMKNYHLYQKYYLMHSVMKNILKGKIKLNLLRVLPLL
jgi:fido (protein-threonine AMPylation protein)